MNIDFTISFFTAFFISQIPLLYSLTGALSIKSVDGVQKIIALVFALVALLLVALKVLNRRLHITKRFFIVCCISIIVIVLYLFTGCRYPSVPESYYSYFLTLCAYGVPSLILGEILAESEISLRPFMGGMSIIALLISVATVIVLLTADLSSTVNALNNAGLNYQTFSYYSVYAYSLNIYFIHMGEAILSNTRRIKVLRIMMTVLNVICTLSGGGRGALILLLFVTFYYLVAYLPWRKITISKFMNTAAGIGFAVFAFWFIISRTTFIQSGITRIAKLFANFMNGKAEARNLSYAAAFELFADKPILGHGIGSVFPEWGLYFHDIFLDIAVEAGIVGVILFLSVLATAAKSFFRLRNYSQQYDLFAMIFLNAMVMYLFSGYYLSGAQLWFAIVFCLSRRKYWPQILKDKVDITSMQRRTYNEKYKGGAFQFIDKDGLKSNVE